jgi:hypothetical protein
MPRQPHAPNAAQGARQGAGARVWCSGAWPADFQPVNPILMVHFSKKLNYATKTIDTKVVDETSLYNICKGCPMFFSMFEQER